MRNATINDLVIDLVEDEDITESSDITSYTVETLEQFADHHSLSPIILNIVGLFAKEGSDIKLKKLRQFQKESVLVRYTGRNIFNNMIIKDIKRNHIKDNKFGFAFNLTLQQVDNQVAQRVEIKVLNPTTKKPAAKTKTKTKKVTNKGRIQVKNNKKTTVESQQSFNKATGKKDKWSLLPPSISGINKKNRKVVK